MFEESLVESTGLLGTRSRWPAILSVAAQALLAAAIIAVPMFFPEMLPMQARSFSPVPPPPPPAPVPPPLQPIRAMPASTEVPTGPQAPAPQRSMIRSLVESAISTADTPISSLVGLNMASTSTSTLGDRLGTGAGPSVTAVTAVTATAAAPAHAGLARLSSGVTAGMLLAPIQPQYPSIAKATGQQGSVVVRAVISRTGRIERAEVISGPALLQNAALEAVEHARYRPYLLNGQPTEVETTVTIHFRIGS